MDVYRIVVTGGPCAGKSTALHYVREAFAEKGCTVLCVPETATELISCGIAPWTCGTPRDFQRCRLALQLEKERLITEAARSMPAEKVLIVYDRGAMDTAAYMTADAFLSLIAELGRDRKALLSRYDAVFHLVSAAKGAPAFYTTANNSARTESPAHAAALDDRVIDAWSAHPYFRVIGCRDSFEEKIQELVTEITALLKNNGRN